MYHREGYRRSYKKSKDREALKVVLDTNVFISAIIKGGNPAKILKAWKSGKFKFFISQEILREILGTMKKLGLDEKKIIAWKNLLLKSSIKIIPSKKLNIIVADPDDNMFLECAIEGECNYIVSGDKHLLDLEEYKGIKILTPKGFLDKMKI